MMTREELMAMNKGQLAAYALDEYDYDLDGNLTKEQMVNELLRLVPAPEEPVAAEDSGNEKRVKISIAESETDPFDVFVSVNGKGYQIKRGMEVDVPQSVLHVLRNAVQTVYYVDEKSRALMERNVPRFAVSVLGPVA